MAESAERTPLFPAYSRKRRRARAARPELLRDVHTLNGRIQDAVSLSRGELSPALLKLLSDLHWLATEIEAELDD